MKTYLVSEELLRQVLDAVVCGASYASAVSGENDRSVKAYLDLGESLRTLLAKEPSDPVGWMAFDDAYMRRRVAFTTKDKDEAGGGLLWEALYRKDTP